MTYTHLGILGVAQLDSFADVIPPRTLNAARDGAIGWVKRDGLAYASNLAVAEGARRRGVARRLMAEVEAAAAAWGFRSVCLVRARCWERVLLVFVVCFAN